MITFFDKARQIADGDIGSYNGNIPSPIANPNLKTSEQVTNIPLNTSSSGVNQNPVVTPTSSVVPPMATNPNKTPVKTSINWMLVAGIGLAIVVIIFIILKSKKK